MHTCGGWRGISGVGPIFPPWLILDLSTKALGRPVGPSVSDASLCLVSYILYVAMLLAHPLAYRFGFYVDSSYLNSGCQPVQPEHWPTNHLSWLSFTVFNWGNWSWFYHFWFLYILPLRKIKMIFMKLLLFWLYSSILSFVGSEFF